MNTIIKQNLIYPLQRTDIRREKFNIISSQNKSLVDYMVRLNNPKERIFYLFAHRNVFINCAVLIFELFK